MMSCNLSTVEEKLPPGFRFHPKDDELVCDYLMKKLLLIPSSSSDSAFSLLLQVDLNKCEPWDLPVSACVGGKEWYFYSQRDRKYATGLRTNRATVSGYWKATGKDRAVSRQGQLVGMRKTLVFYQGRAPKGTKTDWVMHEFRLESHFTQPKLPTDSKEEDWVLCRVFHKSRESSPPARQDESGCASLPDLMDTYAFIGFDHQNNGDDYVNVDMEGNNNISGLVPCFSNPGSSFHVAPSQHVGPFNEGEACDRHLVKAVPSHLISTDVEEESASEARISSTQSYYSGVDFPTMSNMWASHQHY